MNNHGYKMIAPIVITALTVAYFVLYFGLIIGTVEGIAKVLLGIIPLALAGTMLYVCIERIKEIKKGEEDDIGKY